jgi:glycosyltransferase involved in cell wall biosynthesis
MHFTLDFSTTIPPLELPPDLRIVVVVPALNEAESIGSVVNGLTRQDAVRLHRIVVVDNGSTDGTGDIARAAGALVEREERRGYGAACLAGVKAATDADIIVLMDGDAADDPDDLARIVEPLVWNEADLVVGSRILGFAESGAMTPQQQAGNRLTCWLIGKIYGWKVTDLGPFRAIRRRNLLHLDMHEMTYGWSTEMMVKAARAGYRYREVPVRYHRRIGQSKVGGTVRGSLLAGRSILLTTLRYARWKPDGATVDARLEPTR